MKVWISGMNETMNVLEKKMKGNLLYIGELEKEQTELKGRMKEENIKNEGLRKKLKDIGKSRL